jgi:nicotinic acid mononucleotide adenylyltransferase
MTLADTLVSEQTLDVAVLGGAFDPPHRGHILMAAAALSLGFAKEVWLVPSPDRPDKSMGRSFSDRCTLLQLCLHQVPAQFRQHMSVSFVENDLGVFRGSLYLMNALARAYPNKRFGFIMGSDTLGRVLTWNDPVQQVMTGEEFLATIPCLVFGRHTEGTWQAQEALTPWAAESRLIADLDHVAAERGLLQDLGYPAAPPGFSYAKLSSTRVRQELTAAIPDGAFLEWAVGPEVALTIK